MLLITHFILLFILIQEQFREFHGSRFPHCKNSRGDWLLFWISGFKLLFGPVCLEVHSYAFLQSYFLLHFYAYTLFSYTKIVLLHSFPVSFFLYSFSFLHLPPSSSVLRLPSCCLLPLHPPFTSFAPSHFIITINVRRNSPF